MAASYSVPSAAKAARRGFLLALICGVLVSQSTCVTQDESGNVIRVKSSAQKKEEERKAYRKIWLLREHEITTDWSSKDQDTSFFLASLPETVPVRYRIANLPEAGNQGKQASGTAWACGYLVMTLIQRRAGHAKYTCSPAFVYNSLNNGQDRGIQIIDTLEFLRRRGCPRYETMPYLSNDFRIGPHARAREEARKYLADDYARVKFRDLDQIRAHLLQKRPIIISMLVSNNFATLRNTLVWKAPVGLEIGRQTMVVVGYDDRESQVWIMNSLGKDWGGKGFVRVDYSWFLRLTKQAFVLW